jgi:membrane protein required for colicin V production
MFNWLDILLLLILAVAFVLGVIKGLIRQVVGILAVIVGLILAMAFYPAAASAVSTLIKNENVAHFAGFLTIFVVVLVVGWLIGRLFSKAIKGPLKWLNHGLGGFLGLVKGALIGGILVFAMLVFPVSSTALQDSTLAPYCVEVTRNIIDLIPKELKEAFKETTRDIFERGGKDVERI